MATSIVNKIVSMASNATQSVQSGTILKTQKEKKKEQAINKVYELITKPKQTYLSVGTPIEKEPEKFDYEKYKEQWENSSTAYKYLNPKYIGGEMKTPELGIAELPEGLKKDSYAYKLVNALLKSRPEESLKTMSEGIQNFLAMTGEGLTGIPKMMGELTDIPGVTRTTTDYDYKDDPIYKASSELVEKMRNKQQELVSIERNEMQSVIFQYTSAVPSFALGFAGYAFGQPEFSIAVMSFLENLPGYNDLTEQGVPANQAFLATMEKSAITAALEMWGFDMFYKNIAKETSSKWAKGFQSFMEEGTQEGTQQIGQNVFDRWGGLKTKNIFEGVVNSFIYGGLVGGTGAITVGQFQENAIQKLKEEGATDEEAEQIGSHLTAYLNLQAQQIINKIAVFKEQRMINLSGKDGAFGTGQRPGIEKPAPLPEVSEKLAQEELLKSATVGTGKYNVGEVYIQDLGRLGQRGVIIDSINPDGSLNAFYFPTPKTAELLGQTEPYLEPALFKKPSKELKTMEGTTDSQLKQIINSTFFKEKISGELSAPEDSLITEAKKYKSAEEFVNSKISSAGRIKNAEIDNLYKTIPDNTISKDGYIKKVGEKLFPTEKATPELLKNSLITLNKDGSIKEGMGLNRISFTEDLIGESQLTDIWNKANQATPEQSLIQEAKKYKSADIKKETINRAIEEFGLTNNPKSAGFILDDGRMIDSSGFKQGNVGRNGERIEGRTVDHREIASMSLPDLEEFKGIGEGKLLQQFIDKTDSIRLTVFPDNINVDIQKMPSLSQFNKIKELSKNKKIYADISKVDGGILKSGQFDNFNDYKKWVEQSQLIDIYNKAQLPTTSLKTDKLAYLKEPLGVPKKTSKIAKSIEQKALDWGMDIDFVEKTGYTPIEIKTQQKIADDLVNNYFADARKMLNREKALPANLNGVFLITAMEEYAKVNNNVEIMEELANSPLIEETSIAGQTLRAARERDPDSASAKLQELRQQRKAQAQGKRKESIGDTKRKLTKDLKESVKKVNLTEKEGLSLDKFLDSITC